MNKCLFTLFLIVLCNSLLFPAFSKNGSAAISIIAYGQSPLNQEDRIALKNNTTPDMSCVTLMTGYFDMKDTNRFHN